MQRDVLGEQGLERLEIALAGGGEEALRQLLAAPLRRLVPRPPVVHMLTRARGDLARGRLALADDRGDPVVRVVEHVAQEEHRALLRREILQDDEKGERQGVGNLCVASRVLLARRDQRLGQPLADVGLAANAS